MKLKDIGDFAINLPQRGLRRAIRPLPVRWQLATAQAVARFVMAVSPPLRKRVDDNLSHVFPDMPRLERKRVLRGMAENFGCTSIELLDSRGLERRQRHFPIIGPGYEILRQTHQAGKPAIMVSGHFGAWEAIRAVMKGRGMPIAALYRVQNNRFLDNDFLVHIDYTSSPVFPKTKAGITGFARHVHRGRFASILLDQRTEGSPAFDFLGKPALTPTFVAELALKTGAVVVPAYGVRGSDPSEVTILMEPPIPHTDPVTMTQALNDSLAAQVRARPELYYWLHRRWAVRFPHRVPALPQTRV